MREPGSVCSDVRLYIFPLNVGGRKKTKRLLGLTDVGKDDLASDFAALPSELYKAGMKSRQVSG